jgi:hypothetical protein
MCAAPSQGNHLLQVLTANIGTLLELYGVEKGLEHYRSTPAITFDHYIYYLYKEVTILSILLKFIEKRDHNYLANEIK